MFDQRANDQRQPLLPPRQTMERRVGGAFINAENIQPALDQLVLLIRDRLINAYRIKVAGKDHVTHVSADTVFQMQAAADIANMFF